MRDELKPGSNLDPNLREKLLRESKKPFSGIRRVLWIALFGSAGLGLLIMFLRVFSGEQVLLRDIGIQVTAFTFFGWLLWLERPGND